VSFHLLVRVFRASEPALQPQPGLALNKENTIQLIERRTAKGERVMLENAVTPFLRAGFDSFTFASFV
jgi:hypothetical protein